MEKPQKEGQKRVNVENVIGGTTAYSPQFLATRTPLAADAVDE